LVRGKRERERERERETERETERERERERERGSIYLADPIAIIEVRGEEVLASTLDRSRMWRWGPG
jgi:hypothetical protein